MGHLADKMVHLVNRTAVAIGNYRDHIPPVSSRLRIFHKFFVHAREELEILRMVDEDVIGSGDHPVQILTVGVVQLTLVDRVAA